MSPWMIVLLAFLAALWIFGIIGQLYSAESVMRYLTLSMGLVAIGVWRWQPNPALRRRDSEQQGPPQ